MKMPSVINLCDRNFKEIFSWIQRKDIPIIQVGSYTCANYFIQAIKPESVNPASHFQSRSQYLCCFVGHLHISSI